MRAPVHVELPFRIVEPGFGLGYGCHGEKDSWTDGWGIRHFCFCFLYDLVVFFVGGDGV